MKKEKSNRLAGKITEMDPKVVYKYTTQVATEMKGDLERIKNREISGDPDVYPKPDDDLPDSAAQNRFDDMNPPKLYLQSLNTYELDPKFYKNIPPDYLKRIPYAGSKSG